MYTFLALSLTCALMPCTPLPLKNDQPLLPRAACDFVIGQGQIGNLGYYYELIETWPTCVNGVVGSVRIWA